MDSFNLEARRFDLITELAKFSAEHNISLRDPNTISVFTESVKESLNQALSIPTLLHGQRTQAMFEAMVVSLGEYSLFKTEDEGRVYPTTGYRVPDFRVVLRDGTQWLIEVKNFYDHDPFRQIHRFMKREYRENMEKYATTTGAQLKLAVFWARWGLWTLVSPEAFVDRNGDTTLEMKKGMLANELSNLGDRVVGTQPPLRLRFTANPAKSSRIGADGKVEFTIADVKYYCDKDEIVDPVERQIALILMQFGEWEEYGPKPLLEGDQFKGIEFQWAPRQPCNKGFEFVGHLSSIFARYYAAMTLKDQDVVQLLAEPRPEWFEPFVSHDYKTKELPLWILHVNSKGNSGGVSGTS